MITRFLKIQILCSFIISSSFVYSVPVNTVAATINVGATPAGIAITPDGLFAYVANNNNYGTDDGDSVTVIDLTTNLIEKTIIDDSFNQPYTITINPAGTYAYVTNSYTTTITVIKIATNEVSAVIEHFDGPSGMVITSDSSTGYVNNYGAGGTSGTISTVNVVNLSTNLISDVITVGLAPAGLAITSDDAFVYVINYVDGDNETGTISVIQTSDKTVEVSAVTGLSGPFAIAITPDDSFAYVTNFGSNNFTPIGTTVSVVDLTTKAITATVDLAIQPAGIAITPDGKFAYATNYNSLYSPYGAYDGENLVGTVNILVPAQGTVNVIDIASNTVVAPTIAVGQSPANVAISPSGEFGYVSNFTSNTVNVIALPTFEIVAQGSQVANQYLTYTQLVNKLTWTSSGISLPVSYAIYRDAALTDQIGIVLVDEPFVFYDYNRLPNTSYSYYVVGTNSVGTTSDPVIVTIN